MSGFTTHCFKCSLNIDHDALATAKFVRDLNGENALCISLPACSYAHYLPLSAVAHLSMEMGRFTSRTQRRSLLKSSKQKGASTKKRSIPMRNATKGRDMAPALHLMCLDMVGAS